MEKLFNFLIVETCEILLSAEFFKNVHWPIFDKFERTFERADKVSFY